jgi:hypothetical protein
MMPRLPVAFRRTGIRLLGVLSPPGTWASLTVGLPVPLVSGPDPDGVSAYRTCEARLGLGALYIPGIAVSTRPSQILDRRRPRSNGLIPVSPVLRPDPRSRSHETSARVHGYSPHASLLHACDSRTER